MSDQELLELAGKAGEVGILWWTKDGKKLFVRNGGFQTPWNPLDHDGDALRLAVKLGICVFIKPGHHTEASFEVPTGYGEMHKEDPYAATRRAIVRAAAEIGRTK